jgi:HPt (histidine-containing phosphotransfer) domain-containing protein
VAANEADTLRRTAHTLKGSAADFGAVALASLCREIEALGRAGEVAAATAKVEETVHEYHRAELGLKNILTA